MKKKQPKTKPKKRAWKGWAAINPITGELWSLRCDWVGMRSGTEWRKVWTPNKTTKVIPVTITEK